MSSTLAGGFCTIELPTLYAKQKKRHRCTEQNFGLCGRRQGWDVLRQQHRKHVHYLGWNRSPAQAGYMRQMLGPGALGRPRGIGWCGRWKGGLGWGIHVNPWLIHVNVWQKPLQYCKVISLQLIKINGKNIHLLTVLKAGSLRLRCQQVRFFLKRLSLACRWWSPSWIFRWHRPCACTALCPFMSPNFLFL